MHIDIIEAPIRISMVGCGGPLDGDSVAVVGNRLMDKMWREVQKRGIKTKGINHWVYLPGSRIFTGVELAEGVSERGTLEELEVSLDRYLLYVHTGDYSTIPQIWPQLYAKLKQDGEISTSPCLEIYGHWNNDPAKCETTILIALSRKD